MKSPSLPLIRTGHALAITSLRSVVLPGMSCPVRHRDEIVQLQLQDLFCNNGLSILLPGDHFDTGTPRNVGCLARITAHQSLPDGTTLSIFRGLARVNITNLEDNHDVLPQASYQVQQDFYPRQPAINRKHRREELLTTFFRRFAGLAENDCVASLLHDELPLGALCDLLASATRLTLLDSLQLLAEQNVDLRSDFVLVKLRESLKLADSGTFRFPPNFSCS